MPPDRGRDPQPDDAVRSLLARLGTDAWSDAWTEFLDDYASRILQIIRFCERGDDEVGDAFVWVCERLAEHHSRRLRRFNPEGPASFRTWLGVVVHNLCRDWRRTVSGRRRVHDIVARLPPFDRAVFSEVVDRGLSSDRALLAIRASFPAVTAADLDRSQDRVTRRLADAMKPRGLEVALLLDDPAARIAPADHALDPEAALLDREGRHAVTRALAKLPNADRLLIGLRFRHSLTLADVARAAGLKDAQTAERRLRAALARLRALMGG